MRIGILLAALLLQGCITPPDLVTGAGCWRYGIAEEGNTGPLTDIPVSDIPVEKLGYDALLVACGVVDDRTLASFWMDNRSMRIRSCYKDGVIYEYHLNGGKSTYYYEEVCQVLLGSRKNSCWRRGYAMWGEDEERACLWNM